MKIVVSLILVLVMVFGCVGLAACGCEEEEETPATTDGGAPAKSDGGAPAPSDKEKEKPAPSDEEEEEPAPSLGEFSWDDMPIYHGADAKEDFWATVTQEGKEVEMRMYQTDDSVDEVADFYKSEMPDNGWDEAMWMSIGGSVTGAFTKNNEHDFATIAIADVGDEGTLITLTRGQE
jgi:hypothetical protein